MDSTTGELFRKMDINRLQSSRSNYIYYDEQSYRITGAYDLGNNSKIRFSHGTGFLFPAGDINALYRNMSEIFDLYPATL